MKIINLLYAIIVPSITNQINLNHLYINNPKLFILINLIFALKQILKIFIIILNRHKLP